MLQPHFITLSIFHHRQGVKLVSTILPAELTPDEVDAEIRARSLTLQQEKKEVFSAKEREFAIRQEVSTCFVQVRVMMSE